MAAEDSTPMDLPQIDFSRLGPPRGSRVLVVGGCGAIGRRLVAAALATEL